MSIAYLAAFEGSAGSVVRLSDVPHTHAYVVYAAVTGRQVSEVHFVPRQALALSDGAILSRRCAMRIKRGTHLEIVAVRHGHLVAGAGPGVLEGVSSGGKPLFVRLDPTQSTTAFGCPVIA